MLHVKIIEHKYLQWHPFSSEIGTHQLRIGLNSSDHRWTYCLGASLKANRKRHCTICKTISNANQRMPCDLQTV